MNPDSPIQRWFLFDGDRNLLAFVVLLGVFALLSGLGYVGLLDLTDVDSVETVAGGLIPGLFTFISIVLGINQLVLSQSSGSADVVRERVAEVRDLREDVESAAGTAPSPLLPTDFLSTVVETIRSEADRLAATASGDPAAVDAATAYATRVKAAVDRADERVTHADPGRVNAVISLLEFSDSRMLYDARRLRADHGDSLSGESHEVIDELINVLELFEVARTHFRTTYTQRTLAQLSRLLLYVGLPAILVAFALILSTFPGLDGWQRVVTVSALLTVTLSPLAVLSSYILRVAAVSERTIGIGPFPSRPGAIEQPPQQPPVDRESPAPSSTDETPAGNENVDASRSVGGSGDGPD